MITTQPPPDPPIILLFDLLRQYAERQGWIPIGCRCFELGPWLVTVNGTPEVVGDGLPPYHALIEHRDIVAIMVCSPFGGSIGGWQGAEEAFIHDLEKVLAEPFTRS